MAQFRELNVPPEKFMQCACKLNAASLSLIKGICLQFLRDHFRSNRPKLVINCQLVTSIIAFYAFRIYLQVRIWGWCVLKNCHKIRFEQKACFDITLRFEHLELIVILQILTKEETTDTFAEVAAGAAAEASRNNLFTVRAVAL